jgi:hypothetical protein
MRGICASSVIAIQPRTFGHCGARREHVDERRERDVEQHVAVVGVIDDIDDLIGKEPRFDRMAHGAGSCHSHLKIANDRRGSRTADRRRAEAGQEASFTGTAARTFRRRLRTRQRTFTSQSRSSPHQPCDHLQRIESRAHATPKFFDTTDLHGRRQRLPAGLARSRAKSHRDDSQ